MANAEKLETITEKVVAAGLPLLIPDTCCILDIIRSGFRKDVPGDLVPAAERLVERARRSPSSLWIVAPEQVSREYNDHKANVTGDLQAHIARLEWQAQRLASASASLLPVQRLAPLRLQNLNLHHSFADLSQRFLDAAVLMEDDDGCARLAHQRLIKRIPPADKDQQYKDCVIVEHVLAFASCLRNRGFTEKIVFVTSNHNDYGKPHRVKAPLDQEFSASDVTFVSTLPWAESLLWADACSIAHDRGA